MVYAFSLHGLLGMFNSHHFFRFFCAARLAAQGVGASLPPMGEPDRTVHPDPAERAAYPEIVQRWHRVYRDVLSISGDDLPPLFTPPGAAREPMQERRIREPHPVR